MPGGNKKVTHTLSMCDLLLPPGIKGLRFLGVILGKHSLKKHVQLIENKVSKNIGDLYNKSTLIYSKCLQSIYFSFIHTYINHANIAWASTDKRKLEKLLRK